MTVFFFAMLEFKFSDSRLFVTVKWFLDEILGDELPPSMGPESTSGGKNEALRSTNAPP